MSTDLEDIEPRKFSGDLRGVEIAKDHRIPPQGGILQDRPAYLPDRE